MCFKEKNINYKFTSEYWNKISENAHYFKGAPQLCKFKSMEYLHFLRNIYLENSRILKTDLYVEAKNEEDNFLPYFKNNNFVGIDISLEIVKMARKNLIPLFSTMKFVVADVRNLPFRNTIFDTVISDSALAYIPKEDLAIAIMEIKRILKESGKFILSLNNIFNFFITLSTKIRYKIDKRYFFSYSSNYKQILALVKNIGFKIEDIKFIFPFHIFEFVLLKTLYKVKFTFLAERWIYLVNMVGKSPLLNKILCAKFILLANKK